MNLTMTLCRRNGIAPNSTRESLVNFDGNYINFSAKMRERQRERGSKSENLERLKPLNGLAKLVMKIFRWHKKKSPTA